MTYGCRKDPEYIRRWTEANRDKVRVNQARYQASNPEKRLVAGARQRATAKGVPFGISAEDIVIPDCCPVFGMKLTRGRRTGSRSGPCPSSMSLDRIDPAKGYVPGNIQVISNLANSMKSSASREQLVTFAKWVLAGEGQES